MGNLIRLLTKKMPASEIPAQTAAAVQVIRIWLDDRRLSLCSNAFLMIGSQFMPDFRLKILVARLPEEKGHLVGKISESDHFYFGKVAVVIIDNH